jgi:urease accessory protein
MGALELLLADARTPTGSYAHSGGLEAALADGADARAVPGFILARLRTVARCEAALAASAARCDSVDELLALDLEAAARTPAEPLRAVARRLGRALLRTAGVWWPSEPLLSAYSSDSELTPRPVALGVVSRTAGVSAAEAARLSLYDDAATVAAAAVKLLPLDAAVASGWLVWLATEIDDLAAEAAEAAEAAGAASLPSTSTPLLDYRSVLHANNERRLFAS